jgi:hypothetical protein
MVREQNSMVNNLTRAQCIETALSYKNRAEWKFKSPLTYRMSMRLGCYHECIAHMPVPNKPSDVTLDECMLQAIQYASPNSWSLNDTKTYFAAINNGWLNICLTHQEQHQKSLEPSFEFCLLEARKYTSKTAWKVNSPETVKCALKHGWFQDCVKHMPTPIHKAKVKWTLEICVGSARNYNHFSDWKKNERSAYNACYTKGWIEEIKALFSI